jgi:hypothetical protein
MGLAEGSSVTLFSGAASLMRAKASRGASHGIAKMEEICTMPARKRQPKIHGKVRKLRSDCGDL